MARQDYMKSENDRHTEQILDFLGNMRHILVHMERYFTDMCDEAANDDTAWSDFNEMTDELTRTRKLKEIVDECYFSDYWHK